MIRLLLFGLSAGLAVLVVAMARRGRAATLDRLAVLVGDPSLQPPDKSNRWSLERLLPASAIRHLRLLGFEPTADRVAGWAGGVALAIVVAGLFLGVVPAAALAAVIFLASSFVLSILANRRIAELGAMMPGFFDRVRQLLIIGNSLPNAFSRAVHGAQPRLAAFFAPAIRRIGNGAGFSQSIRQSADDIGLYEMHLFAVAVSANMRFGGSLTHSLNNLVIYLRKRASVERELRASTAQVRFSAWLLALLPILVATLIVSQNQEYARWFVNDDTGRWMLLYCAVSQVVGIVVMQLIIKTEF